MPWSCKGCGGEVPDNRHTCAACGHQKTSWTVVAAVTRTMRVSRRSFTLRRGRSTAPRATVDGSDPETEVTTQARVLERRYVDALRASGRAPAPADTLYVALAPGGAADLTVRGEVLFAGKPSETFEVPLTAPAGLPKDAVLLVPLVLVRGAGPALAADAFPGATVIDVDEPGEDGAAGHAPSLEVQALDRPAQAVELVPRAGVARGLLGDVHFETAKCFVLPTALSALRALVAWYAVHRGHEVLIVGHADRAGGDALNLALSLDRARALSAFLRDDVDAWAGWYDAAGAGRWGPREDQYMLSALTDEAGPFYGGVVDGAAGPATAEAVRRFQTWSNAARGTALAVDGACGPLTRRALIAAYMAADGTTLPAGTPVLAFGCGEHFPAVATADGVSEARNRRVDVMFFPDGVEPRPEGELAAGPDDPHYPAWLDRIEEELGFEDRLDAYELLVAVERVEDYDDRFELASSDGAYTRTLALPDGEPCGAGVVLYFDGLLDGPTYTLTHLPDPSRRVVLFAGATRAELLLPRPAPHAYDPPAPPGAPLEDDWTGNPSFVWTRADERVDPAWLRPLLEEAAP